jgi:hypothetical protein
MEPDDYKDAHVRYFIRSVGLLKGWNKEGCSTDHWRLPYKGRSGLPLMRSFNSDCSLITHFRVRVTLWLAVYCQSVHLGTKPLEAHDQRFIFFFK